MSQSLAVFLRVSLRSQSLAVFCYFTQTGVTVSVTVVVPGSRKDVQVLLCMRNLEDEEEYRMDLEGSTRS